MHPQTADVIPPQPLFSIGPYQVWRVQKNLSHFVIYDVTHEKTAHVYSIKTLKDPFDQDTSAAKRLALEGKVMSLLEHPNLGHFYELGRDQEVGPYVVTQKLTRGNMALLFDHKWEIMSPRRFVHLFWQVTDCLEAVHEANYLHNFLTPENILISEGAEDQEVVTVVDFSLASEMQNTGKQNHNDEDVLGSAVYMSPERILGKIAIKHPTFIHWVA